MTDEERDQIDTDAETYMRTCSVAIEALKSEGMITKVNTQRDTAFTCT